MLHETTSRQTKTDAPVGQARNDAMATKTTQQSGTGWVYFAGTLLLISGAFMLIDGIAAVSNSTFYAAGRRRSVYAQHARSGDRHFDRRRERARRAAVGVALPDVVTCCDRN